MFPVTKKIIENGLANRIIRVSQMKRLLNGTSQRRYNLVNRAVKKGELLRFYRGLYIIDDRFRDYQCHPFSLAQAIAPGSYISFETALTYHGWIPESVYEIRSVIPGRKSKSAQHEKLGIFNFRSLPVHKLHFLEMVKRHRINGQNVLVAQPLRALMDLICKKKLEWNGIRWLVDGLRIDFESLLSVSSAEIKILEQTYNDKRTNFFIVSLSKELKLD